MILKPLRIAANGRNYIKTLAYSCNNAKPKSSAGGGAAHLAILVSSVGGSIVPHTPTQLRLARSLARTTRTRNETETDFPVGLTPPTSDL